MSMGTDGLKEKLENDIKFTSGNYANMYTRLKLRDNISKFLIVYYSVIAVINAIIPKVFVDISADKKILLDFLSLLISIILLVASLSVSLANYSERCTKAMQGLNKLKRMKKMLSAMDAFDVFNYRESIAYYHEIVDNIELRTDYDYYLTCKDFKVAGNKIPWLKRCELEVLNIIEKMLYVLLIIAPLALYFNISR